MNFSENKNILHPQIYHINYQKYQKTKQRQQQNLDIKYNHIIIIILYLNFHMEQQLSETFIHRPQQIKIDEIFYKSFLNVLRQTEIIYIFNIFKAGMLILFLLEFPKQKIVNFIMPLYIATISAIVSSLANYHLKKILINTIELIQIATELYHLKRQNYERESYQNSFNFQQLPNRVDSVYDYTADQTYMMTQSEKQICEKTLSLQIEKIYLDKRPYLKALQYLYSIVSLILFVYFIICCMKYEVPPELKNILIVYFVIEGLIKINFLITLCFLTLLPLICLIFFLYNCFFKKKVNANKYVSKLQAKEFRNSFKLESDPTCSICYQDFYKGDSIMVLDCSKKHAFHQFCIKSWFKVGSTCPLCRYDFR